MNDLSNGTKTGGKAIPPQEIPRELENAYTMEGRIPVKYFYLNDACSGKKTIYKPSDVDGYLKRIKNKETFYYGLTDTWLYRALEDFPIHGQEVAIMGSVLPVYESVCLYNGGKPTTIDYNKIFSEDNRIKTLSVDEYEKNPTPFEAAFSISSFEHDGLGRYGDPLNPNGDFEAMKKMKSVIVPNSLLFLAIPVGEDALYWNAHRIYGTIRLPLLFAGWKLVKVYPKNLIYNLIFTERKLIQPVFVLKNAEAKNLVVKRVILQLWLSKKIIKFIELGKKIACRIFKEQ